MGSKKTKHELIAGNEATRHRLEALGQIPAAGGRGETDHQRVAEELGEQNHRLPATSHNLKGPPGKGRNDQ